MPETINEVCYMLPRKHAAWSARKRPLKTEENHASQRAAPPLPRISRLMALAIHLQESIGHEDLDFAELARMGRVSRSRITQILNLLHLAPDIQEHLLFLPPNARGRDLVCEKKIRVLAFDYEWERQRLAFRLLTR